MKHYLIAFPAEAMQVAAAELPAVDQAARAVIREAKQAGVYVFGGGLDEAVAPVRVSAQGVEPDAPMRKLNGGFCVLKLASREAAVEWAAKLAAACRCAQELREFMFDPES
jgi:hypothetical protein